jgi:hypothetical protein
MTMDNDTVTTQPRILAIAFYDPTLKHDYKLVIQNSTFILNHDNPYRDDPFDDHKYYKRSFID